MLNQSFLRPKNPSHFLSPLYDMDILALAGRATKSIIVKPVKCPAECYLPVYLSLPAEWWIT